MSARRFASLISALLLVQGLSLPLSFGQGTTATVRGRVVDTDGIGLPGVPVVIKSRAQGSGTKQVVTDIEGNYRIPLLPPAADYFLTVDYPGFARTEYGPLDLDPGKITVADLTLRSDAETTETIRVESRGNVVDTESGKTSSSYNAEFIEGLPIIGHNYQDILTLAPGVTDTDGDGNPNVHGARSTGLQYRLDGANITDPVSGTFGANLNVEIIEELEVITSGASAEYGRADGGFTNIITKSGGNDFEGKLLLYWQGIFLNGEGTSNNTDFNNFDTTIPNYRDIRPTLNVGGAIIKDKLWYFGSAELLDHEVPLGALGSFPTLVTSRGNYSFGKLTWQVNSYNKLALQVNGDPREFRGLGLGPGVAPDSDFVFDQGSLTPQIKWTSTISPQLLLESNVSHYDSGISVESVSKFFSPQSTALAAVEADGNPTVQALYPCAIPNCEPSLGEREQYQLDIFTGRTNGPFFQDYADARIRNQIKTDLSYNIEDALGQHNIKSGIEFADEKFGGSDLQNPILVDVTRPFESVDPADGGGAGDPNLSTKVSGFQFLLVANPLTTPLRAESFNSSVYLLDAWKPRPNLTINAGLRIDREDVDTNGFEIFDPRVERRQQIALWRDLCAAARNAGQKPAPPNRCALPITDPQSGRVVQEFFDGKLPTGILPIPVNSLSPELAYLAEFDFNGSGFIEMANEDIEAVLGGFTNFAERETENFSIANTNLAPRLSLSWDPWADGKTRVFGNWSRYYDRLILGAIAQENGPDVFSFAFFPSPVAGRQDIRQGDISQAASTITINQVDRGLRTPHTDELSLGIERELAPEWSVSLTYINRKGFDLLQDQDVNHFTCGQSADAIGINPMTLCGDAGALETDRFGSTVSTGRTQGGIGSFAFSGGANRPNQFPDLYVVNNGFNQILRVGNFNSYDYESFELKFTKRQHRNWQMQASYTWSEVVGQAEDYFSDDENDPQTTDDVFGHLDFDQRHVLKFQAVTRLPHEVEVGSIVQWASGTPFAITRTAVDRDDVGNQIFRTIFPTEQRNDQRNGGFWKIDGRVAKNFVIGKVQALGYVSVENILDYDYRSLEEYELESFDGISIDAVRDIGRRFELGMSFAF